MSSELAWAIGLFEGEGCIYLRNNKPQVHLFVRMTDLDVLERLQALWGGTIKSCTPSKNPNDKPVWRWALYKKEAVKNILIDILPHLSARRSCKALDGLDYLDGV